MSDVFVDFGAANDGDGTSHLQAGTPGGVGALNTLEGKTFNDGDVVWIRRSASALTLSGNLTLFEGVSYIGWPESGDSNYIGRPSVPTWDADGAGYATISTSTTYQIIFADGVIWHGLEYTTSSSNLHLNGQESDRLELKHCKFTRTGTATQTGGEICDFGQCDNLMIEDMVFDCPDLSLGSGFPTLLKVDNCNNAVIRDIELSVKVINSTSQIIDASICSNCLFENVIINITNDTVASSSTSSVYAPSSKSSSFDITINNTNVTGQTTAISLGLDHCNYRLKAGTGNPGLYSLSLTGARSRVELDGFTLEGDTVNGIIEFTTVSSGNVLILNNCEFVDNGVGDIVLNGVDNDVHENSVTHSARPYIFEGDSLSGIVYSLLSGGGWRVTSPRGIIETSVVARQGGSLFSLYTKSTIPLGPPIRLSDVGSEGVFIDLLSGINTINMFGAYKGFSNTPDNSHIWFEVDYWESGIKKTLSTKSKTSLLSDASTWNNEVGLTAFRIELQTPNLASATTGFIRIYSMPDFGLTPHFYIDPTLVVT